VVEVLLAGSAVDLSTSRHGIVLNVEWGRHDGVRCCPQTAQYNLFGVGHTVLF
jgi:hypothetical protein